MGVDIVLIGVALAALGVMMTLRGDALFAVSTWLVGLNTAIGVLTPTLGGLLVIGGVLLVYERRQRARRDLDTPLPDTITNVRVKPIGQFTGSSWQGADIVGEASERLINLCRSYLDTVDLHFVAFFTKDGDCQFYVDVLDDHDMSTKARGDTSDRRRDYIRHGRHIRFVTTELDQRLRGLNTGKLVRTVLDVEQGALFLYDLSDVGFLLGVTLDQAEVDPADWKMSSLANDMLRAHGRQEDDDFYRYCPVCRATNRSHGGHDSTVVPIQRPRHGSTG